MAKKKATKKKVAARRANRPLIRPIRSPLVFFELGRRVNSFLYWSICGLICPAPVFSLLENNRREGEAPAAPQETSGSPHAHGSAGVSPPLFQQAVMRAVELAATEELAVAWRAALTDPAAQGRVAGMVRAATDQWREFNKEQWGTEVHPDLFRRLVGHVPEPDADSDAATQLSRMATPHVQAVEASLLDSVQSTLSAREMQVLMLGRAADQIDRPLDLELIGHRVANAFQMRAPHEFETGWGAPRSEGVLFRWRTAASAVAPAGAVAETRDDAAEESPDVTVNRLKEALLPAPGLADNPCFPVETPLGRNEEAPRERHPPLRSSKTPLGRDDEIRRAVFLGLKDQLRQTAAAWHSTTDGLLPSDETLRRSTVRQLVDFLKNWTASLGASTVGLREVVGHLESENPEYGFLDVWVSIASKFAGRRGLPGITLDSPNAAILLATLSESSDGEAGYDALLRCLSPGADNMNTVHKAKSDLVPSLPSLGLHIDTMSGRGYRLVAFPR